MTNAAVAFVCDELQVHSPALGGFLRRAGEYRTTDPRSSVVNMRFFVNLTTTYLLAFRGEAVNRRIELSAKIDRIRPTLKPDLGRLMVDLVRNGNIAAHELEEVITESQAERLLQQAIRLGKWLIKYMRKNREDIPLKVREKLRLERLSTDLQEPSSTRCKDMDARIGAELDVASGDSHPEKSLITTEEDEAELIVRDLCRLLDKIESSKKLKSKLPPKTIRRLKRALVVAQGLRCIEFSEPRTVKTPGLQAVGALGAKVVGAAVGLLQSIEFSHCSERGSDDSHSELACLEIQRLEVLAELLEPYKEYAAARQSALADVAWAEVELES